MLSIAPITYDWPIGTVAYTGHLCPQTGVYTSLCKKHRSICRSEGIMPQSLDGDTLWELDSYLIK